METKHVSRYRYRISAIDKIRAAGYQVREAEIHTIESGDPVRWVNAQYPGSDVSSLDLRLI